MVRKTRSFAYKKQHFINNIIVIFVTTAAALFVDEKYRLNILAKDVVGDTPLITNI